LLKGEMIATVTRPLEQSTPIAPPATPQTFRWLCTEYFKSAEFKKRDRAILESCCLEPLKSSKPKGPTNADLPLENITLKELKLLRDRKAKADLPEASISRVKTLRRFASWARDEGHFGTNPAAELKRLKNPNGKDIGADPLTDKDVEKFLERWGPKTMQRRAFLLMLRLGLAKVDAIVASPKNRYEFRGKQMFTYERAKTGVTGNIPIPRDLLAEIDDLTGEGPYLKSAWNRPFASAAAFGNWMRDAFDKAGIKDKSSHSCRKKFCIDWSERGCTAQQLARMAAWADLSEAEVYIRMADAKKMAAMAGDLPLLVE
jgi:integrase